MTWPRGLLAAGVLFWGWQTENLAVGAALALLVEAPRWTARRFELDHRDLARIADLCTVVFVGLTALLAATRGVSDAVLVAIEWLPAVLAPVLLSQCLSSGGRIPLSALFRYVRKRKRRDASTDDPLVDVSGVYLVLCAVAAGIGNMRDLGYYAGVVALAAWALYAVRPRHAPLAAWGAALAIAGGAGYAGQAGLSQLQSFLEAWAVDLQLRGMDADPYRSTTDIGSIGRLKLYDAIVMRVYADPRAGAQRLHRASFTTYAGTTWHARKARMAPLEPEADGATWTLAPGAAASRMLIVTRLEEGKALLALPAGAVRISSFPAAGVKRNALGAVQADVGGDWGRYVAESAEGMPAYALPDGDDLEVPAVERGEFERLAVELGLSGVPAAEAVGRVERHFGSFSYSTFREAPPPAGTTVLADFLRTTQRGHCEYFAAATTLALRAAGIPARYATGFAMSEYSDLERAYVVRARHAHAWTRAWVDGRWVDVDTTPPSWLAEEAGLAPAWQGLSDLLRWAMYRWSQREAFGIGAAGYAALALLVAVLAWRIVRRARAASAGQGAAGRVVRSWPGEDSEFYAVERVLAESGAPRAPGEALSVWASGVAAGLDEAARARFERVVELHLRYRFDPAGIDARERAALRETAFELRELLRDLPEAA
jgi:hypothetical protein